MIQVSAQVKLKIPAFDLSDKAKIALAKLLLSLVKRQARDGVQVTSEGRFPVMPRGKDGKRIDLVDTGALFREVRLEPLKVVFTVHYAQFVLEKYAAGLSPRYQQLFNENSKPIVAKGLIVKGAPQ